MADNETNSFQTSEISLSRTVRFALLLLFDIPAITCSIFVLYHLITNRHLRLALHNHTIIVLLLLALVFQLTDVPMYLNFTRRGAVWPETPGHCLIWWLVDLGFYNTVGIVLAWASVERHILIFHADWTSTKKQRILIHYIPLITLLLYATIYYTIVIFFPPCQHYYDYTLPVCSACPCHLLDPVLGMWEMGVHGCLCTIIITVFNIALLIRVLMYNTRGHRLFNWKKCHKVMIQVVCIATLYALFNFPIMIIWVARLCGMPRDAGVEVEHYAFFLTYWVMLLLPVVALLSLPRLKRKILKLVFNPKKHRVGIVPIVRYPLPMAVAQL